MDYIGVLKRVFPFLLTFAAGLFIASFFVSIAAPNFGRGWNQSRRGRSDCGRMKMEFRELKRENLRLQQELDAIRGNFESSEFNLRVPPPPPIKGTGFTHGTEKAAGSR